MYMEEKKNFISLFCSFFILRSATTELAVRSKRTRGSKRPGCGFATLLFKGGL